MKELTLEQASAAYEAAKNERSDWEQEWRDVSDYLLPGRGVYQLYTRPRKRALTSKKVINTVAEDALYVLTSGMHGALTSPALPWFKLSWTSQQISQFEPLKMWLQDCEEKLHTALQQSNFYSIINSFYTEYAGFGTGCVYVGEDTDDALKPFRFELLTAGEYAFAVDALGRPNEFFRILFKTPAQIVEMFGRAASENTRRYVTENRPEQNSLFLPILEVIRKEKYGDKIYTQRFYEFSADAKRDVEKPLAKAGFYEWPYPLARWSTIGSDVYGVGPGSRALPDIKRLQEMEKAFLMATHKTLDPPVNAPARMRGKLNTLPGGVNYYANPNEAVKELYQVRFDFQGISAAVERVEQRIQRNFFNDIFLSASRDPNASPYKAAEVIARDQEKMLRLGPIVERLQNEFLQPIIERCFNIMLRKKMFISLSPELAEMAGDYRISLVSPLATAQRGVALQGINSFLAFIGQAAQFSQEILDNVDVDEAARTYGDITGVKLGILRPQEAVDAIRKQRAEMMAQEKAKQDAMAQAQVGSQVNAAQATAQKTQAEAGQILADTQQTARATGMI